MKYSDIIFDMDGTLTESGPGIYESFRLAMEELGRPLPADMDLSFTVGPPLLFSFKKLAVPEPRLDYAVSLYRKHYNSEGYKKNAPYEGIIELLQGLKALGCRVHIATSKPEATTRMILDYFDMTRYFEVIGTADDKLRPTKAAVLKYTMEQSGQDPAGMLMVGDRYHDVEGAKANALPCVGVTWGYGGREELETAGAEYIIDGPEELLKLVSAAE